MSYDILPRTDGLQIRVFGKTKVGLFQSALKGLFAAAEPHFVNAIEPADRLLNERQFSVQGNSAEELLVNLLNEVIALSDANQESYEEFKFSLITDTKAEGYVVDRPVKGFDAKPIAATAQDLKLVKNEEKGEWEATIRFEI